MNPNEPVLERQTVHIADDTGRIAMLEKRTIGTDDSLPILTRYVYSNHLQSASLELDGIGDIISYEEYHPYGTTAFQAKNASINATAKRYRYTGKERDEESGLYYHGARYYIPWLCRWTAIDPLESKYAGMSPYNYSFNNPVMWNDPSGAEPDGERITVTSSKGNTYSISANYYPKGYENELTPVNFTGDRLEMTDYPFEGLGSTGTVNYVIDKTGEQYSILKLRNSNQMYSWVNLETGLPAIYDPKNEKGGGWIEYITAEQARQSSGAAAAEVLAQGVGYGIMGGVALIAFAAALPYLSTAGALSTSTSASTAVAGSSTTTLTMGGTLGGLTAQEAAKIGLASSLSLLYLNYASQTGTSSIDYTDAVNNAPDHPEKDFFIKYTNAEGLAKFLSEGVLRPNDKGKVYLTKEFFSPEQVERDIFLSQEYGKGRGDFMLIFLVDPDQSANIQKAETDPYEWTYSPGSLKIRSGNLLYMGPNPKR